MFRLKSVAMLLTLARYALSRNAIVEILNRAITRGLT